MDLDDLSEYKGTTSCILVTQHRYTGAANVKSMHELFFGPFGFSHWEVGFCSHAPPPSESVQLALL